ncbi:hypothetical protein [Amycolatopsis pigmentata]|uniref:Uncharacterized protein n=1 Tax=Amycolatopsis pigmentata TaxID=450801 RepID=A0ABW5G5T4_9PSEU
MAQPEMTPDAERRSKPFTQYTQADWNGYNHWAAGRLRDYANQSEAAGNTEQAARERHAADQHESWIKPTK